MQPLLAQWPGAGVSTRVNTETGSPPPRCQGILGQWLQPQMSGPTSVPQQAPCPQEYFNQEEQRRLDATLPGVGEEGPPSPLPPVPKAGTSRGHTPCRARDCARLWGMCQNPRRVPSPGPARAADGSSPDTAAGVSSPCPGRELPLCCCTCPAGTSRGRSPLETPRTVGI